MFLPRETLLEVIRTTPLISIDMVIHNPQDEILLGYRVNRPAQHTWFVPGGKIMKNETLRQAFARISRNELGRELSMDDCPFLGVYEHFYRDNFTGEPGISTQYIVLAYQCQLDLDLAELPSSQHHQYRWWSIAGLLADPAVHLNTRAYFDPHYRALQTPENAS